MRLRQRLKLNYDMALVTWAVGVLILVSILANLQGSSCGLAFHINDFCYRTPISINKSTAGNLTDYPVALTIDIAGLIANQRTGQFATDILTTKTSSVEVESIVQDLTAADSTVFAFVDITGSANTAFDMYSGNAAAYTDQGIVFHQSSGADTMSVPDDASLDPGDLFQIQALIQSDTPDANADIFDKLSGFTGYALRTTNTGTGQIEFEVAHAAGTDVLAADWDGSKTLVRGLVQISDVCCTDLLLQYFESGAWVTQDAAGSTDPSVPNSAVAASIGAGFEGVIYELEFRDGGTQEESENVVSHWSFNPGDLAETQRGTSGNSWTYLGTAIDTIGSNDATYSLINSQANLTVTLGPQLIEFADSSSGAGPESADIVGDASDSDLSSTGTDRYQVFGGPGKAVFNAVSSTDLAPRAFKFILLTAAAIFLGGFVYVRTDQNSTIAAMVMIAVFGVGAGVQFIEGWWAIIAGFMILGLWFVTKKQTE